MGLRRSGDIRGVRDIRTYSGRVDAGSVPYLAYMKISCLEMEKARREKERNSAIARMRNIDSRIHDIDAERNIILKKLEKHEDAKQALISRNDGAIYFYSKFPLSLDSFVEKFRWQKGSKSHGRHGKYRSSSI